MNSLDIIITIVCSSFLLTAMYLFRGHRTHLNIVSIRRIYMQNIARIETIVVQANQLSNLASHIDDQKIFLRYEEALKMLEALLSALAKIPPLSDKGELVRSMEPMLVDLEGRIQECRDLFKKELSKRRDLTGLFKGVNPFPNDIKGCYFCSKPYSPRSFRKIQIKFQGQKIDVFGCSPCRAELRSKKSVDILFFTHNKQTLHWSEMPGYDPKTDFWTLGSRNIHRERPKLELLTEFDSHE